MKTYKFSTPHGDYYTFDENGRFIRSKNGSFEPSDSWKITGIIELIAFGQGRHHSFARFIDMIENGDSFTFKNGKPKYTIQDLDHGTTRIWGNTTHHGINRAWRVNT